MRKHVTFLRLWLAVHRQELASFFSTGEYRYRFARRPAAIPIVCHANCYVNWRPFAALPFLTVSVGFRQVLSLRRQKNPHTHTFYS